MRLKGAPLLLPLLIGLILSAALPVSTFARTWYVNIEGTGDAATIQAAIDTAGVGDEIVVGPGHYTWSGQGTGSHEGFIRFYTRDCYLTLRSEMGPESTILDAEYNSRVIYCHGNNHVTLEGFTITRGVAPDWGDYVGGGYFTHIAREVVRNCIFIDNRADLGGAISCVINDGFFYVEDCLFIGNTSGRYGGAIMLFNGSGDIVVSRCEIKENRSDLGGAAIGLYNCAALVTECVIRDNYSQVTGGAVTSLDYTSCTIEACTIIGNDSAEPVVYGIGGAVISIERTILAYNKSPFLGGDGSHSGSVGCSDIFENEGGDAIPAGYTDAGNNIYVDPLFCDSGSGDFHIRADSPCWPGNRQDGLWCMTIGAMPIGCGAVSVSEASWGRIKSLPR